MLEGKLIGTIRELELVVCWDDLSKMIGVDYWKRSMVPEDERFAITGSQLEELFKSIEETHK